ncbi:MAG: hypothetical protein CWE10_11610 [Symbiobacterium thermophilum]|uniref:Uncharacterized protein n=1 Tax=Symbiobacterium thermophilum TaxID=2734 RepID=A0A953IED2_SYMTR|nr:hypothetical protein [Symbiobacterium thermophilum]
MTPQRAPRSRSVPPAIRLKSLASSALWLVRMASCQGFRPRYQAGNYLLTTSDLPCRGGMQTINRLISPRSTASSFWHKSSRYLAV